MSNLTILFGRIANTDPDSQHPCGPAHLIDVHDDEPLRGRQWTARCGAVCSWRTTTITATANICTDCEAVTT